MSLCTHDDVTMVDICKQSTATSTCSSTHVKKTFQMNIFHDGLKVWMDLYRHVCPENYLKYAMYAFSIYKVKYDNRIGESLWQSWRYIICIIIRGLCSYNARLFYDDVTAIWVFYWRRREFPNYARLHRDRMVGHDQSGMGLRHTLGLACITAAIWRYCNCSSQWHYKSTTFIKSYALID